MAGIVKRILDAMRSFHDWNKRRKWITDQEQARLERAEIEAEREAKHQAMRRYVKERRGNPTEDEIQAEIEKLRNQNQGNNPLIGGGGESSPDILGTGREPKMPDALGNTDDDDNGGLGP